MEELCHPHVRVREEEADGDIPEPASLADCTAVIRWQAAFLLGNHHEPVGLGCLPWSYALSLEENSLAFCLEAYVQQSELEHVAKRGVGDLMPFIWTCMQISALSAVPLSYQRKNVRLAEQYVWGRILGWKYTFENGIDGCVTSKSQYWVRAP